MAKKDDIKVKTDDQLATDLSELKREQFNLRFQSATNQLEKPSRVRVVRSVGKSISLKRFATRARGRSTRIVKPFSRIRVVVREQEEA